MHVTYKTPKTAGVQTIMLSLLRNGMCCHIVCMSLSLSRPFSNLLVNKKKNKQKTNQTNKQKKQTNKQKNCSLSLPTFFPFVAVVFADGDDHDVFQFKTVFSGRDAERCSKQRCPRTPGRIVTLVARTTWEIIPARRIPTDKEARRAMPRNSFSEEVIERMISLGIHFSEEVIERMINLGIHFSEEVIERMISLGIHFDRLLTYLTHVESTKHK